MPEIFYLIGWYMLTSLATILSSILFYYSSLLYRNFKRSERFALLMFFTKPKISESFRVLCFFMFVFLVLMAFVVTTFLILSLSFSIWLAWLDANILLFCFIYFFKTLAENTRE